MLAHRTFLRLALVAVTLLLAATHAHAQSGPTGSLSGTT